jgi:hypothetical protein
MLNHKKSNCTANDLIVACACGLACSNCGACKCKSNFVVPVETKDLTDMLALAQADIEATSPQGVLDEIRDTLRFVLHDAGVIIDPDIQANDSGQANQNE